MVPTPLAIVIISYDMIVAGSHLLAFVGGKIPPNWLRLGMSWLHAGS